MKLYHGTSYEAFKNILNVGFSDAQTVWDCSESEMTYFWEPSALVEAGEVEEEDATDRAIQLAFESAQIAAALFGSIHDRIVVIEYEADPGDVQVDESCENMTHARCVHLADRSKITAYYTSDYYPDLRLFYLKGLRGNQYLKHYYLPDTTQKALDLIPDDVYLYELMEGIDPQRHELKEDK